MKKQLSVLFAFVLCLLCTSMSLSAQETAKTYTVDQILAQAPSLVGQNVRIEGTCKHVCAVSGRKLFLQASDGVKLIRINAGSKMDKFDRAAIGKVVAANGVVVEHRTYKEDLDKQEAAAVVPQQKQAAKEHCATEAKANGEDVKTSLVQRIRAQKEKLAKQIAAGGQNYFATYTIDNCNEYSIAK